ncbi:MAG: arginase family protein, partial [Hyphomicrobiales bacterium]|nr:arginase family protein [Hyphomicrobiales bacterium]
MSTTSFVPTSSFMGVPRGSERSGAKAAIIGLPFDCGAHPYRIGARLGPSSIREQSLLLRPFDIRSDLDPLAALGVVDMGDAPVRPGEIEPSFAAIEKAIGDVAEHGVVPVSLGGDGAIALPEMRALHRFHPDLVTVHIDAHTDAYPIPGYNTATAFARAVEERLVDAAHSFQIGMRGSVMVPGVLAHARELGYNVMTMDELLSRGIAEVFAKMRNKVGERPVYLSYDMDFFDPSIAPGVCTPTWGGA